MFLRPVTFILFAIALHKPIAQAVKLPAYLKACSRDDPNLGECAKKNAIAGMPYFINGDRKYNMQSLNPLEIVKIKVVTGSESIGLNIDIANLKSYGLPDSVFEDFKMDYDKRTLMFSLMVPRLESHSQYKISGKILLLPITGHGDANVTMINVKFDYSNSWDLVKRNGKEYLKFKNGTLIITPENLHLDLQNLFNGDKVLGSQMNNFMNENWRLLHVETGPPIGAALAAVVDNVFNSVASMVPNDDMFPKGSE